MQTRNQKLIVTIDDQHLTRIQHVAHALAAAGMQIENVLPGSGIITGCISQELRSDLKTIEGVLAIETDTEMNALQH